MAEKIVVLKEDKGVMHFVMKSGHLIGIGCLKNIYNSVREMKCALQHKLAKSKQAKT